MSVRRRKIYQNMVYDRDQLKRRVKAAEKILLPLYDMDQNVRDWFGPEFARKRYENQAQLDFETVKS